MNHFAATSPNAPNLPCPHRAVIMRACSMSAVMLCLVTQIALAQESSPPSAAPKREELEITMQIIADPDAKLPEEVVRRIPLPARKSATESASSGTDRGTQTEAAAKGQERAREARELGREMSERGKERAQEAAEQREQAGRSRADERRRNPDPPAPPRPSPNPPNPPRP